MLVPEEKLVWSPIVANSRMNRERNASGTNSYEKEFKFKPETFLEEIINKSGKAAWLDLCCGCGKALTQVAEYFRSKNLLEKISFTGIDLVDNFIVPEIHGAQITYFAKSVTDFEFSERFDLITCVHGLQYVGDKLKAIQHAVRALKKSGVFIANLGLENFAVAGADTNPFLKKWFKENRFTYNARTKILIKTGGANIQYNLKYLGADDHAGPNYTGQEAVTSHYEINCT